MAENGLFEARNTCFSNRNMKKWPILTLYETTPVSSQFIYSTKYMEKAALIWHPYYSIFKIRKKHHFFKKRVETQKRQNPMNYPVTFNKNSLGDIKNVKFRANVVCVNFTQGPIGDFLRTCYIFTA